MVMSYVVCQMEYLEGSNEAVEILVENRSLYVCIDIVVL